MRKRTIQPKTSFALGLVGAGLAAVAGLLMLMGQGAALFLHAASFALYGAMLLFLATAERGDENKGRRVRLLVLFFLLLVSYFNQLVLLNSLCGLLVFPLLLPMYKVGKELPRYILLVVLEVVCAVVSTLSLTTTLLGESALVTVGGFLFALSAARALCLLPRYRKAAEDGPVQDRDPGMKPKK